jgi:hypothetical protein
MMNCRISSAIPNITEEQKCGKITRKYRAKRSVSNWDFPATENGRFQTFPRGENYTWLIQKSLKSRDWKFIKIRQKSKKSK